MRQKPAIALAVLVTLVLALYFQFIFEGRDSEIISPATIAMLEENIASGAGSESDHKPGSAAPLKIRDTAKVKKETASNIKVIRRYLEQETLSDSQKEKMIRLVSDSPEIYTYLKSVYISSLSSQQKLRILEVLDHSIDLEKSDFAMDLMHSTELRERQSAYRWLKDASTQDTEEVNDSLVDAIFFEDDTDLLTNLMLSLNNINVDSRPEVYEVMRERLKELTTSSDDRTAATALGAQARLMPDQETLSQLQLHLTSHSPSLTFAAVKGLYNYEDHDQGTMDQLRAIRDADPNSVSSALRASAATLLMRLGDYDPSELSSDPDADE